jgi:hypothetical protein
MIIPRKPEEAAPLFRNTIRECLVSCDSRRAHYARLRRYALYGSDTGEDARRNKIDEFVESSSAMCYASEFVRLHPTLPRSYGDQWIEELDAARDVLGDLFLDSGTDQAFGQMVWWAHVYPSMFCKVLVSDHRVVPEVIQDPSDLGVWRERLDSLDKQEAIVHRFDMDIATFERMVRQAIPNREDADDLISEAYSIRTRGASSSLLAPAMPSVLFLAGASPNISGAVSMGETSPVAQAQEQAEVVQMCELWIRDDYAIPLCDTCRKRQGDDAHQEGPLKEHVFEPSGEHEWEWRKVLALGPLGDRIMWSSLNPLLRQREPFRQLCLKPVTNYLWGDSLIRKLIPLQLWGEDLINKHMNLLDLQLDPPIAILGMHSVDGEKAKLLRQPGGAFTIPPGPGIDIKRLAPDTPPDVPGVTKLIDDSIDRAGGLPMGSQGQAEPSMRSAGQMTAGAMLSSPRTNQRAIRVEDSLEEIMTDELRLHRRISKDRMRIALPEPDAEKQPDEHAKWAEKPYKELLLSQMPGDLNVRVSAHSASPLFRNEMRQDAITLKREGAIDLETFVEIYGPALEDVLRAKARKIQKAAAKVKERAIEIKEREAAAKEAKAAKSR